MLTGKLKGTWSFLIGEPDETNWSAKLPKGPVEITADKFNAYKGEEVEISISLRDIKKVSKETRRGTLLVKVTGRYKQIYTFIPSGPTPADKQALVQILLEALQKSIPAPEKTPG